MSELMVSVSGLRGTVGDSLTPEVLVRYTSAYAEYLGEGPAIVGWDGRTSGAWIEPLVRATLAAAGREVLSLGIVPTPTVQLAVELFRAAGGIVVTASHNPVEWNGLKFIGPEGLFIDEREAQEFWKVVDTPPRRYAPWNSTGKSVAKRNILGRHIQEVLSLPYISMKTIRKAKYRVVVDCINGAGSKVVPDLLKKLGCSVMPMNCEQTGIFAHQPEPLPENLHDLCAEVVKRKADLGVAVDPDADRLVLIMENGEPFIEEYTVTTAVRFILRKLGTPGEKVVVNLSTTRAVDDVARAAGAEVIRTKVGEIHVARRMKEIGAVVGGEGNGGVILPAVHYGRDSLVGIVLILQELAEFGGTISEYRATLPHYVIVKQKYPLASIDADAALATLMSIFRNEKVNTLDGLRIDFADGWVHVRKSNTEPILRIFAEATTESSARELALKVTGPLQI